MKKLVLTALMFVLGACTPSNITQSVQKAFLQQYPGISPRWEVQPTYGYEAIFSQDGLEYEVEFAPDGTWLETEYEVPERQFPQIVLNPKLVSEQLQWRLGASVWRQNRHYRQPRVAGRNRYGRIQNGQRLRLTRSV